ncbi:DNA repair protein RecN [Azospirillaceae bacterium]
MLVSLSIRDVVLIERLTLSFRRGLCVLTGETGAGKSILLDALGLALGSRGDSALVRRGATQASVIAEFELPPKHPAFDVLREQELETGETLVLRRVVNADGRGRAYVNDQPVSMTLLRRVGEQLVEIHGQFDTHGLLDSRTHRSVLDAHAGLETMAAQVAAAHRSWRQVEKARAQAAGDITRAQAEEEYLRHAAAELEALDPKPGEEARLAEERITLQHREKLIDAISAAQAELIGERGVERAMATASRLLSRVADKAGGRLDAVIDALDQAAAETHEAIHALHNVAANLDLDSRSLEKLEDRLFALRAAARKHNIAVDHLPILRTDMLRRLSLIEDQGDLLTQLAKQAEHTRAAYVDIAKRLSKLRREAAQRLDQSVAQELLPLKLDRARFVTQVDALPESEWSTAGIDRVCFLVTTNPGSPPGQLNKIASGGELARFMLALKVVVARSGTIPTMVFDEVDTGIGGAVAAAVGERLERLGREVQELVVTHSPQVAARGGVHLQVRKKVVGDHVVTEVVELDGSERREEIARMLAGAKITDEARAAADALISGRH